MAVKLRNYLQNNQDIEQNRKLFYEMSKTMEYIHGHGYYIKSFNLDEVEILNLEKLSPIQYNTVIKMDEENKEERTHEDIYNLAFMQIGIYSDMLDVLRPEFLKDHFESFTIFLPEDDVAYFRGIVTKGASVYYSKYIDERNKMKMHQLIDQTGEASSIGNGKQKSKSTAVGRAFVDKDTKKLYTDISRPDAAYISFLLIPLIMIILALVLSLIFSFV